MRRDAPNGTNFMGEPGTLAKPTPNRRAAPYRSQGGYPSRGLPLSRRLQIQSAPRPLISRPNEMAS